MHGEADRSLGRREACNGLQLEAAVQRGEHAAPLRGRGKLEAQRLLRTPGRVARALPARRAQRVAADGRRVARRHVRRECAQRAVHLDDGQRAVGACVDKVKRIEQT